MNYVLDVTPRMVEIFEQELRRPYPFAKLDIVAAPQWPSGATELSAAITYREQLILVGDDPAPRRASVAARCACPRDRAHVAGQPGNTAVVGRLVAQGRLRHLGHAAGADHTRARWRAWAECAGAVRSGRCSSIRWPARAPSVSRFWITNEIRNAYDSITYSKSLGVIHMVDQYFGSDVFRPALGRYVETFADGVADSTDFYRVIGEETNSPALTETFRGFMSSRRACRFLEVELHCDARRHAVADDLVKAATRHLVRRSRTLTSCGTFRPACGVTTPANAPWLTEPATDAGACRRAVPAMGYAERGWQRLLPVDA